MPAPRRSRLEVGALNMEIVVPADRKGRLWSFFQDRMFVGDFFARTGPGRGVS